MNIGITNKALLNNLGSINILLGKNGAGKSSLLKIIEKSFVDCDNSKPINATYITPERGGVLVEEPNIESNINNNATWLNDTRRVNQYYQFKQQTIAQYKEFEVNVLREIANEKRDDKSYTFTKYIDQINSLLDNIKIISDKRSFSIIQKTTGATIKPISISSGESELISLAIECLIIKQKKAEGGSKFLLLDEPDVHLHPDLQVRFMRFIRDLTADGTMSVIIATHSTALLGALESGDDLRVAFMKAGQTDIEFKSVSQTYRDFLPVFGAHPLSNIFNEAPILLVEGEDDERIWQSAVRSSLSKIKVYPCVCGSISEIAKYEKDIISVINSIYDSAIAYSLRDKDDSETEPDDEIPVIKFMLKCRNAENLLLTDDVLSNLPILNWDNLKVRIDKWIEETTEHDYLLEVKKFRDDGYNRQLFNIKNIRNIIMHLTGSSKPWEVAVGQSISKLNWNERTDFNKINTLYSYLGEKLIKSLVPKT